MHDEKNDTIRKENIRGGNIVTDHSEREANKSVFDHENDALNSS